MHHNGGAALQYSRAVRDLFDPYSAAEHNDAPRRRYLKFVPTTKFARATRRGVATRSASVRCGRRPFTFHLGPYGLVLDWTYT